MFYRIYLANPKIVPRIYFFSIAEFLTKTYRSVMLQISHLIMIARNRLRIMHATFFFVQ